MEENILLIRYVIIIMALNWRGKKTQSSFLFIRKVTSNLKDAEKVVALRKKLGVNYEQCRKTIWLLICHSWLNLIPMVSWT